MLVIPIKTHKIEPFQETIYDVLDKYLPEKLEEESVVSITSKILAICQGRVKKIGEADKDELIKSEADLYISRETNKYNFFLTVKNYILVANSGLDESNGNGYYILWPEKVQAAANQIREYLCKKYHLRYIGVLIVDSRIHPLRRGSVGIALSHSGFLALNDYVEKSDIFGRELKYTKANIPDGLACTSVLVMGEGAEQTPLCLVQNLPFIQFQDRNPTTEELEVLQISLEEDVHAELLRSTSWYKGGGQGA